MPVLQSRVMTVERRAVLERLRDHLSDSDIVVAALAGTTADTYQVVHRPENLYLVGLGMVTQVSLGLALTLPESNVVSLDTDGSLLLGPSILPVAAASGAENLRIIVFDNEQLFGSRGGAPSQTAAGADLTAMALAAGIRRADTVADEGGVAAALEWLFSEPGPALLTAKIALAARAEGPSMDGQENKYRLVRRIEAIRGRSILAPPKP
ncbi:MAG: thiamine pyrophosphate-dependent enzyme [Deltaproteobacteria bacterium]|nr:thiamine pyrophosphate-dependent enzyme [Deltaproteobacteria bacterium]